MKGRPEHRNHIDITPGLFFFDAKNPNPSKWEVDEELDNPGPWLVIHKMWHQKMDGGFWEYLCLGPGPVLEERSIQWIVRIYDPKFQKDT